MLKVYLSPQAEGQLDELLSYLENKWSKTSADTFLKKLVKSFKKIARQPRSCPESKVRPNIFKCVVTKQTSFFYRIKDSEIEIISVSDNRQNPDKIESLLDN